LKEAKAGRKAFFFEKKKQKTFDYFGFGLSGWSEAMLGRALTYGKATPEFFGLVPLPSCSSYLRG
jgi:hypothetical protein